MATTPSLPRLAGLMTLLFLTPGFMAAPAGADVMVLTHPDASWSLRLDLPGYVFKPARMLRDRTQVWAAASSRETGGSLTAFVEKKTTLRQTAECRDYFLKKMAAAKKRMTLSESGGWALAEDTPAEVPAGQVVQRTLHGYLYHDDFCIDVQFSKQPPGPDDRALLVKILEGLREVPASKDDMARAAAYAPLAGPAEQTALEAASKLRAKDFAGAEALLEPLCPDARRQTPQGRASADCSLRNAGLAEARNVNQGRDLANLYWRAGDLLAKDGRPDAALEAFQKGLDILPGHADIWFSVGMARRDKGEFASARMAFDKSLALRPNDARTMYWIATTLMDQGKLVEADAMLDQVEKTDPKEFHVWFRRAEILMMRGHYNEAIATFEKAQSLGVSEDEVRARIKECRDGLAREKKRNTPSG